MRLSVVIPHFYAERRPNLQRIVTSLSLGVMRPDEVIIWNNDAEPVYVPGSVAFPTLVVQSPRNVGAQARLLAATMARGKRVLFLDNDVAVRRRTVENLLAWSARRPDGVVTLEGRIRTQAEYRHWPKIYGHGLTDGIAQTVDLSLGRGEMVRRDVLLSVLGDFPFAESTRMDDLYLSRAYEKNGVLIDVVPCTRSESDLEDLPMYGVGMCREPDFYQERARVVREIACDPETLRAEAESA